MYIEYIFPVHDTHIPSGLAFRGQRFARGGHVLARSLASNLSASRRRAAADRGEHRQAAGAVAKSARLGTPHEKHCKSCHPGRLFLLGHVCYRPIDGSGYATVCIPGSHLLSTEAVFSFLWTRLFRRSNLLSSVWDLLSRRFRSSGSRMTLRACAEGSRPTSPSCRSY